MALSVIGLDPARKVCPAVERISRRIEGEILLPDDLDCVDQPSIEDDRPGPLRVPATVGPVLQPAQGQWDHRRA